MKQTPFQWNKTGKHKYKALLRDFPIHCQQLHKELLTTFLHGKIVKSCYKRRRYYLSYIYHLQYHHLKAPSSIFDNVSHYLLSSHLSILKTSKDVYIFFHFHRVHKFGRKSHWHKSTYHKNENDVENKRNVLQIQMKSTEATLVFVCGLNLCTHAILSRPFFNVVEYKCVSQSRTFANTLLQRGVLLTIAPPSTSKAPHVSFVHMSCIVFHSHFYYRKTENTKVKLWKRRRKL